MINLLSDEMRDDVQITSLTRKLTVDGVTEAYQVYRVRLNRLYYNDQNDRIASWISQYKSENGADAFHPMDYEAYNSIIEQFIIQSNEAAIEKTQMNIALVNQREPGVILADGRIIDGNRRFTCLRRLSQKDEKFNYFETVVLNTSIETGKKQIKMLELAIQHGEESKVDYNPIDRLVGVYLDIIETGLLTVEEYARSTNESEFEVKRKIESALLLIEFLDYINMPNQYHIARDYQVVSALTDLQSLLRKCDTPEMRQKVKNSVFTNFLMRTVGDNRKYIRNLSSMMDTGFFLAYIKDQEKIGTQVHEDLTNSSLTTKGELESFVSQHEETAEALQMSLDRSLLKARKNETRNRPSQIVSKSISLLRDVDTNIFAKLTDQEKENLRNQLGKLATVVERYDTMVDNNTSPGQYVAEEPVIVEANHPDEPLMKPRFFIAASRLDEPFVQCISAGKTLSNLSTTLEFLTGQATDGQKDQLVYRAFFIDENNTIISDIKELTLESGKNQKATFSLSPKASKGSRCMLALQSVFDNVDELQQLLPFKVAFTFTSDFDF